ncbi:Superoxide dismutase [Cu-Zn] precursor [Rubripirellula tenax]|uniref:Superoxide dismutase [Cu-Zn] n=1 Tax=Rubripirellula tenax TaxID=2528015 RepID=A0A5C6EGC6_9BACT|nr:superoxide dismutase family protein [Rubripirellula tenax]TWU46289.1 Superoxide dismutase [Cu-Zn] precursor [Rubripirellula tenax]
MLRSLFTASTVFSIAFLTVPQLSAQEVKAHADHAEGAHAAMPNLGIAVVVPTKENKVRGVIRLSQTGDHLHVVGKIRNLSPGEHGFHIHEFGDLRNMEDGTSAGGHFNPSGAPHGAPDHGHVGDLGNITADGEGVASIDITVKNTQLHFVLGRAFVIHADKDDLTSQPSGAAGPRVGLGIIGVGNPEFKYAPKE